MAFPHAAERNLCFSLSIIMAMRDKAYLFFASSLSTPWSLHSYKTSACLFAKGSS